MESRARERAREAAGGVATMKSSGRGCRSTAEQARGVKRVGGCRRRRRRCSGRCCRCCRTAVAAITAVALCRRKIGVRPQVLQELVCGAVPLATVSLSSIHPVAYVWTRRRGR